MAVEQFANFGVAELDGAINGAVTSVTVISAATLPAVPQFRLRIENELMLVTGVAGLVLTVTRGIEGTTAVAHADGSEIRIVVTKSALEKFREDNAYATAIASADSTRSGALCFPTDAPLVLRSDGAVNKRYGLLFELTEPSAAGWSWYNQDSTVQETTVLGQHIKKSVAGAAWSTYYRNLANVAPYTIIAGYLMTTGDNTGAAALVLRSNQSGQTNRQYFFSYSQNGNKLQWEQRESISTFDGVIDSWADAHFHSSLSGILWNKITNDGTNIRWYISKDTITWHLIATKTVAEFFSSGAPLQTGIAVFANGARFTAMHLVSWREYNSVI